MSKPTQCPQCHAENIYEFSNVWTCPDCAHEWTANATSAVSAGVVDDLTVRDAHGNPLQDGDSVTVIKDLKVRGTSSVVKVGTKVKAIRLVESSDGHNIACRIDGFGAMNLKSEFVKKSQ